MTVNTIHYGVEHMKTIFSHQSRLRLMSTIPLKRVLC